MTQDQHDASPDRPPVSPGHLPPPPPPPGGNYYPPPPPPVRSGKAGRIINWSLLSFMLLLLISSLSLNFWLSGTVAALTGGPHELTYAKGDLTKRIVILPVIGAIDQDMEQFVATAVKQLKDNPPKAVVLRVNSGGGGVGASDRIHYQLQSLKQELGIPVVASFGSVAASGGYYVAAGSDYIFGEVTGITGSIGVMAQIVTVDQLLQKIGVTPVTLHATQSPEKLVANDITRPWNEQDKEVVRQLLDHSYERFLQVVYEGRKSKLADEQVARHLADGSIYTSQEAQQNGLIDEQGYLDQAIDKAKALAGMSPGDNPRINIIQPASSLGLGSLLGAEHKIDLLKNVDAASVRRMLIELTTPRVEFR